MLHTFLPSPVCFFYLPHIVLIKVEVIFYFWMASSSSTPSFHFLHLFILFLSRVICPPIFLSAPSFNRSPSVAIFKSVVGNNFGKSAKDRSWKFDTDVVIYEEQGGKPNLVDSVTVFDSGVALPTSYNVVLM